MNTSTRISLAAVIASLIVAAFCFSACPNQDVNEVRSDKKFFLKIGKRDQNLWVDVTSQDDFNKALINLKRNGAHVHISYLCEEGGTANDQYDDHPDKCDKTKQDGSPAGDPNATQHVHADSPQDLEDLLKTFK
jgi:hypothetical protein